MSLGGDGEVNGVRRKEQDEEEGIEMTDMSKKLGAAKDSGSEAARESKLDLDLLA